MKEDHLGKLTTRYEKGPQHLEREFTARQSNVLPLDAARNEGSFYGKLFRGGRPLSGSQRVGFVLVGFIACAQAFFVTFLAFPGLAATAGMRILPNSNRAVFLAYLPFAALICFLGIKLMVTAVTAPSRR
jgi:hypothetical protein